MRPNKIKQMWAAGKPVTLGWLSVSHSFTAEIMARQGFDALCVDLQHGTNEMSDVLPMLQAISQTDTVPVVRVAWNEPAAIMRAYNALYGVPACANTANNEIARDGWGWDGFVISDCGAVRQVRTPRRSTRVAVLG